MTDETRDGVRRKQLDTQPVVCKDIRGHCARVSVNGMSFSIVSARALTFSETMFGCKHSENTAEFAGVQSRLSSKCLDRKAMRDID